jgi:hypothetical protein
VSSAEECGGAMRLRVGPHFSSLIVKCPHLTSDSTVKVQEMQKEISSVL